MFNLTQDYRDVLDEYRLFHIVIMKQDIRTLLVRRRKGGGEDGGREEGRSEIGLRA